MNFCDLCGTKASESAKFCSGCGSELQDPKKISKVNLSRSRNNSRRRIALSFGVVIIVGALAVATLNVQSISSSIDNFLNPTPERVFLQLSKLPTNQGWLQSLDLEVRVESNKSHSYKTVLEQKISGIWESVKIMNVTFSQENMLAKNLNFYSYPKPGTRELRVKVLREEGSHEIVEISESFKVRILKLPEGMQIANDSNNSIIWRFAKENERPQFCSKYSECYFLKVASTKRCTIKATLLLENKVVSISSASRSSIGSVAAYTPKKSYLIEVPYNSANTGQISARCFALSFGSTQESTPTPTKSPFVTAVSHACSIINADLARARREEEDFFIRNHGTWYGREQESWYWDILQYNREAKLNDC